LDASPCALDAYCVEIVVKLPDGKSRRGSGYVTGRCRIITALHILIGSKAVAEGGVIVAPDKIQIRSHGDFEAKFRGVSDVAVDRAEERFRAAAAGDFLWRPASLLWPPTRSQVPRFDLAVLAVEPSDALDHVRNAPVARTLTPQTDSVCRGMGFPSWNEMKTSMQETLADPCVVEGELTLGPARFRSAAPFTVRNGGPPTAELWAGLSGAAFFAVSTRALVAIAAEVRWEADNTGLWLTRLGDVPHGGEFEEFWQASGLVRPIAPGSARARSVFVIGGNTGDSGFGSFESVELQNACRQVGEAIARAGAELIVCSPFPDSADIHSVLGYARAGAGGTVHFHSPQHPDVEEKRAELIHAIGKTGTRFVDWWYPGPETTEAWGQAWLLAQLQALERADLVVAIGGRLSNTANTLLHLTESRRLPLVPFTFLGGAARRAFDRRDWRALHPNLDASRLHQREAVGEVMEIANHIILDRVLEFSSPLEARTVFISRARRDGVPHAETLSRCLNGLGFTCLLGDSQVNGDRLVEPAIADAIQRSQIFIALWSAGYAASIWCNDELELALEWSRTSKLRVWIFNIDGSDVVPREARRLPQVVARSPDELVTAVRDLLEPGQLTSDCARKS
jgi:hypothetical protein